MLHNIREREISKYLHALLCEIEDGANIAKASFDHGGYKNHLIAFILSFIFSALKFLACEVIKLDTFISAMKFEFQYGRETADQHYGRGSLSLQSVMTHANRYYEEVDSIPVKTVHHFFGPHSADANHHFTITVLDQYINLVTEETAFDVTSLEKLVLVCDGSEAQNWSVQVMGNLVRRFREVQDKGFFGNLKTLLFVKKSPGHGKVHTSWSFYMLT